MRYLFVISIMALLSSCLSGPTWKRNALVDQVLIPRTGHTGLTNSVCLERTVMGECRKWDLVEYQFTDGEFRNTVNDLGFVCKVGEKRYRICRGEPALCRNYSIKKGWFSHEKKTEVLAMPERYQFLLDSKTQCFQEDRYPFSDM